MMRRVGIAAWLLSLAVFLAITVYYIVCHHVSPLSRDQWHMIDALLQQGLWRTSITTVSGHRHLLAFLLYDIDLKFFQGNNHFLIAVNWLLNLAFIAVIITQVQRCIADAWSRWLLSGWIIVLLCWLLDIALLGWGFNGINNFMSILNSMLAIVVLHRAVHEPLHRRRDAVLAVLLAGLATLSFGNGILVWPVGLVSLYLWGAPLRFIGGFALGALALLAVYLLLPGGSAVGEALRFNGWHIVLFPLEVTGGPLYHLLRAWRVLPEGLLMPLAQASGVLLTVLAVQLLWQRLRRRGAVDRLDALAIALVLTGYGTDVMLTLTRVEGVLDPTVDRFQIWALLVWVGVTILLYRSVSQQGQRIWRVLFMLFPLLALPAQLDWGARLAEYRTRVDNALLAYQVYLPVAEDAEKALHWNWENKLTHLFAVLEYLRERQLNIFTDGAAVYLGRPLPETAGLRVCQWTLVSKDSIAAKDVLETRDLTNVEAYRVEGDPAQPVVGWRWFVNVEEASWDAGLIADGSNRVRGLLQPVQNSLLPRMSGVRHDSFNAYGVARMGQATGRLVLLQAGHPLCVSELP
jgi:hypothetical protein